MIQCNNNKEFEMSARVEESMFFEKIQYVVTIYKVNLFLQNKFYLFRSLARQGG